MLASLIGYGRLLDLHPQKSALGRGHGCTAKLVVVHLAETLQPLELRFMRRTFRQETKPCWLVFQVDLVFPDGRRKQRGLGTINEALLDKGVICLKKNVSSSVRMWLPSTSASARMITLW